MPEQLQAIIDRFMDWWRKFTRRQQIILISVTATVIIAIAILAFVLTRPTMVTLVKCEDAKQAAQVKTLLTDNEIAFETSSDGMTYTVKAEDEANASILLGSNEIPTTGYTIEDALGGSFTTTEADKEKRYQVFLESRFEDYIETLSNVKEAKVSLNIPHDDGTLIAQKQDTYAAVQLELISPMTEEQAAGLARYVATQVGNDTTDSIFIMDNSGNTLFAGGESSTVAGIASSQLTLKQKYEAAIKNEVRDVIVGTDVFDNVEIGLNLNMDFNQEELLEHEYYVEEGLSQGYLDSSSIYNSNAIGGAAAVPDTDTNNDTTYMLENNDYTESSVSNENYDYLPNERLRKVLGSAGNIDYANSSITVVATSFVTYDEDLMEKNGELGEQTFEEFELANNARTKVEVDEEFYDMISKATGFAPEQISFVAYEVPFFQYSTGSGRTLADYLQILLAVLILVMLGYVVYKSTRQEKMQSLEPELSVESLLESTKDFEEEMEEIGYHDKSEARLLIEKFVDEKPEAVASLLRNWLNEDWD